MFMKIGALGVVIVLICTLESRAQNYQAIKGSPYAGALGAADNPAAILNTPYRWDITVFSAEVKNTTNAITFTNRSYLSLLSHLHPTNPNDTVAYNWTNGDIPRYAAFSFNVHLLNVRLNLGKKKAISFGANLRGYTSVRMDKFNFIDTLQNMYEFMSINQGTNFRGQLISRSWLELYGTYSKTLWDDERGRLNGGVTLRLSRGLSGAFVNLSGGTVSSAYLNSLNVYSLATGTATYAYSSNYDMWNSSHSTGQNISDFIAHSQGGAAVDLGFEYLVKSQAIKLWDDPDDYFDYEWKFGAALLDLGENEYAFGTHSRYISNPNINATDVNLNNKFDYVGSVAGFNDSIRTIVDNYDLLMGKFRIWNPARLELNVDRSLPDHFAVNAGLTLNLGKNGGNRLFTKEITLLAVTPRWETRNLGGYLPIQVTTDGKVWVGGAFKAGPILLGVHNWADIFTKTHLQNGGFYLALVIHPGEGFKFREPKEYTCPKN